MRSDIHANSGGHASRYFRKCEDFRTPAGDERRHAPGWPAFENFQRTKPRGVIRGRAALDRDVTLIGPVSGARSGTACHRARAAIRELAEAGSWTAGRRWGMGDPVGDQERVELRGFTVVEGEDKLGAIRLQAHGAGLPGSTRDLPPSHRPLVDVQPGRELSRGSSRKSFRYRTLEMSTSRSTIFSSHQRQPARRGALTRLVQLNQEPRADHPT